MNGDRLWYSSVEYQPDLTAPTTAVPLGVIVVRERGTRVDVVVRGRQLAGGKTPPEVGRPGTFALAQLHTWVHRIGSALVDSAKQDVPAESLIGLVCKKWRFNLFVTSPRPEKSLCKHVEHDAARLFDELLKSRGVIEDWHPVRPATEPIIRTSLKDQHLTTAAKALARSLTKTDSQDCSRFADADKQTPLPEEWMLDAYLSRDGMSGLNRH